MTQNKGSKTCNSVDLSGLPNWAQKNLVGAVFSVASSLAGEARIVGGSVRDWLAGVPVGDIDMAVNRPIETFAAECTAHGIKVVETGLQFGTVTLVDGATHIEVTQTRRDVETDGRHAVVAHCDDWQTDARRRDFTVNALYLDHSGRVHDPLGGRADLEAGYLRFVGVAADRVQEDALRMLRYCRFLPRFLEGGIDKAAREALGDHAALCASLSGERVAQEMRRIMVTDEVTTVIELMRETALDRHALGLALSPAGLSQLTADADARSKPMGWLLALAVAMPAGSAAMLAKRLRLSGADSTALASFDSGVMNDDLAILDSPQWQQAAYQLWPYASERYMVQSCRNHVIYDRCRRDQIRHWVRPELPLRGADLLSHGVDNGPALGQMLTAARHRWIASNFTLGKEALLEWLIGN